jgi:MFS family permease
VNRLRNPLTPFLLISMVLGLSLSALIQMSPVLAAHMGASYTEIGLSMGAARLTPYVILSPIIGLLLKRIPGMVAIMISAALMVSSHLLLSIAGDLTLLTVAQIASGISMVFYYPVSEIILATIYHGAERMRAFSKFGAASAMGFLAGSMLSGVLAQYLGLQPMFLTLGVLTALTTPYITRSKLSPTVKDTHMMVNLNFLTKLLPAFSVTMPFFMIFGISQVIIPGYAALSGISELEIGLLFLGMWVARILTSITMARRPVGNIGRWFLMSGIVLSTLLATVALYPSPTTLVILLLAMGAVIALIYILTLYLTSVKSEDNQHMAIGAYETVIGMAFLIGTPLAGAMADILGIRTLFLGLSLLGLLSGIVGYLHRR